MRARFPRWSDADTAVTDGAVLNQPDRGRETGILQ
jgi:hypothetical protein